MSPPLNEIFKYDLKSSFVVFLVALPLCLGIAVASGAPPISGLIAGIVGGIVVGSLSKSQVSVSGPAAGLTVIVLDSITSMGSFPLFLGALVVAGLLQLIFGLLKAGVLSYYFPLSVIKGMLAAIGLILILKQIPHALGYDKDFLGDFAFLQPDQHNTFTEIFYAFQYFSPGAIPIILVALFFVITFDLPAVKNHKLFGKIPGALLAVISSVLINFIYQELKPEWALDNEHLVTIPIFSNWSNFSSLLIFPDFSTISTSLFWSVAGTLAVIGSVETLLSIEAGDKMDPYKRKTPASRELIAQGIGNSISGFLGGLPLTAVIVRTSANIESGARSNKSTILHGILLLILVFSIPNLLNKIPLSGLAAVLLLVGYKLAKPSLFIQQYKKGWNQFLPFFGTILAILLTDLLIGIGIGLIFGLFFVVKSNFHRAVSITERNGNYLVKFQKDVSFLNKAILVEMLNTIPKGSDVIINATMASYIDHDIQDVINTFIDNAESNKMNLTVEGYNPYASKLI
ncbi:MAG: SulP family inorganic anion transporter [Bacteroidota bacterium]|jgi:MFS superfamily sulfate permease-like transporter|nr:SulP family inorganic anion transporter [Algoriphagus sp.]